MSMLNQEELSALGFKSVGKNVRISNKASFYNCANIEIGDSVRIDDFCVLSAGSGGIKLGSYIHIGVFSSLIGSEKIEINDFCNISSRVSIYSSSDDYSGSSMTNPMIPEGFKVIFSASVILEKHVLIGSSSVVLPGVHLSQGVAIGAMSLVKDSYSEFSMVAGIPAKKIKDRRKNLLKLEEEFLNKIGIK
jgi:dTDP-4-amino-4,6-dideoxy-D-glucose acyltransferase